MNKDSERITLVVKSSFGFVGGNHIDPLDFELEEFAGEVEGDAGEEHRNNLLEMIWNAARDAAETHLEYSVYLESLDEPEYPDENMPIDDFLGELIEKANQAKTAKQNT